MENSEPDFASFKVLSYGEETLYMRRDSLLGREYSAQYKDDTELNQSVWVIVSDCE